MPPAIVAVCNRRAMEILEFAGRDDGRPPAIRRRRCVPKGTVANSPCRMAPRSISRCCSANRSSYERRRPNGTIIEVRTVALPDGGLVRTYHRHHRPRHRRSRCWASPLRRTHSPASPTATASTSGWTRCWRRRGVATADLVVLCLDLDRFKAVNDTLGHECRGPIADPGGTAHARHRPLQRLIGRMGGDEFAIVLPGAARAGAELACRRLLESIRMPYDPGRRDRADRRVDRHRDLSRPMARPRNSCCAMPIRRCTGQGRGTQHLACLCH